MIGEYILTVKHIYVAIPEFSKGGGGFWARTELRQAVSREGYMCYYPHFRVSLVSLSGSIRMLVRHP